jgi:ketosteroid isomerase-like protein
LSEVLDRFELAEDAEWHVPGAVYRGRDEVLGYLAERQTRFDGSFRMATLETLVGDGHLAVLTVATVTKDGLEYSWRALEFYLLREGRIASCWMLPFDRPAFDAIWA